METSAKEARETKVERKEVFFEDLLLDVHVTSWLRVHGEAMTESMRLATRRKLQNLSSLYLEDRETGDRYADAGYWEELSGGALRVGGNGAPRAARVCDADTAKSLRSEGHATVASGQKEDPLFATLRGAILNLERAGWPPAFVFVYDEAWSLIGSLFETMEPELGSDCFMEPDLNCWFLKPAGEKGRIGDSFNQAHRDMRYDRCHDEADEPTSYTVWMPLSDATVTNGCMRVIPVEFDDFFYSPDHAYYSDQVKAQSFDDEIEEHTRPLLASAGDVVIWSPSLVHWGGRCDAGEPQPRVSIAATFRKVDAPRAAYGITVADEKLQEDDQGPKPLQRTDLNEKLDLRKRLAYVAKALIQYGHWHPSFPGLDEDRLELGAVKRPSDLPPLPNLM